MDTIRQFKCIKGCNSLTPFDLRYIAKPNTNFVICSKCGRRWEATALPSCCRIDIRFACGDIKPGNTLVSIQSFNKVK
jgi:hypothetical protein